MKKTILLLIALLIGILIGWVLGYLNLPYVDKSDTLLLGIFLGFIASILLITLLLIWSNRRWLNHIINKRKNSSAKDSEFNIHLGISIFLALFIVLVSIVAGFIIYQQNNLFHAQNEQLNKQIKDQVELIESIKMGEQVPLINNVLNALDDELKSKPNGKLSEGIISRVAAVSKSLKPYRYAQGDSLSLKKLSPEKGQLLIALCAMNIDSVSFSKIKQRSNFSRADLEGATLEHVDLSQANLKGANFRNAVLTKINLSEADLRSVNFWGANMEQANLNDANMRRVDLSWAAMKGSTLKRVVLNGARLNNTQLMKSDLSGVMCRDVDFSGAMLNEANLSDAFIERTKLYRANLSKAKLINAFLYTAYFDHTNLKDAVLIDSEVSENWFKEMDSLKVTNHTELMESYQIMLDTVKEDGRFKYRLKKLN